MSVFLSSGEASGDHYTANIARALRRAGYGGSLWGMVSVESREAGVRCDWEGEQLQLIGLTEIISSVPKILKLINDVVERIIDEKPAAVVVADSPDYHLRLLMKLRRRGYGGKVFYISPPTVWAWRSWRVKELKRCVDECLPLFEFEHKFLLSRGCESYWIGHPFIDEFIGGGVNISSENSGRGNGVIAFLPGSRRSEVKSLLPVMERAARELESRGWRPVFSVAPGMNREERCKLAEYLRGRGFDYYEGPGRELLRTSACSVAASGTITVEALLLDKYQVVVYRLNAFSALVARLVINIRHYAMANILYGSQIFPELLQERATSENIVASALEWLEGEEAFRAGVRAKMNSARLMLGEAGAYDFWAGRIMDAVSC